MKKLALGTCIASMALAACHEDGDPPAESLVPMPSVVGMTVDDALARISERLCAGRPLYSIVFRAGNEPPPYAQIVARQTPEAQVRVGRDVDISLFVRSDWSPTADESAVGASCGS